jgi:hypothetical protein
MGFKNPEVGNQFKCKEKNKINRSPNQKVGMDSPKKLKMVILSSNHVSFLYPHKIHNGNVMIKININEDTESNNVAGSRSMIEVITGFPVM